MTSEAENMDCMPLLDDLACAESDLQEKADKR